MAGLLQGLYQGLAAPNFPGNLCSGFDSSEGDPLQPGATSQAGVTLHMEGFVL